jgi:TPP-dependent pyruvate/acetoin dehydrogenase alpha subunit
MTGHSAHDGGDYVPKHLWEEWAAKDPIVRLESVMIEKRWVAPAELDRMNAGIAQQIDEAIEWAEKSPYPDPADLLDGVYAPEL